MSWLRNVLNILRGEGGLPTPAKRASPELQIERLRRHIQHNRTERLARLIEDYRAQDQALRR